MEKKVVVIAEDNQLVRELSVKQLMRFFSLKVEIAEDGGKALDLIVDLKDNGWASEQIYVLSDLEMGGGQDLCAKPNGGWLATRLIEKNLVAPDHIQFISAEGKSGLLPLQENPALSGVSYREKNTPFSELGGFFGVDRRDETIASRVSKRHKSAHLS